MASTPSHETWGMVPKEGYNMAALLPIGGHVNQVTLTRSILAALGCVVTLIQKQL